MTLASATPASLTTFLPRYTPGMPSASGPYHMALRRADGGGACIAMHRRVLEHAAAWDKRRPPAPPAACSPTRLYASSLAAMWVLWLYTRSYLARRPMAGLLLNSIAAAPILNSMLVTSRCLSVPG